MPEVDLFAFQLNSQVPRYVSWLPDPAGIPTKLYLSSFQYDGSGTEEDGGGGGRTDTGNALMGYESLVPTCSSATSGSTLDTTKGLSTAAAEAGLTTPSS